jgi:CheY-like chemotaxis protein
VISYYLQQAGLEVDVAENGRVACRKALEAQACGQAFDLILMDMQMPELDGYNAAATLRTKGFTTPIVALTAHAMADDRAKCLDAGCTDYLQKPIDKSRLFSVLNGYLGAKLPSAATDPNAPDQQASVTVTPPVVLQMESEPELLHFLPAFIADLPAQVNVLHELMLREEVKGLARCIHQLKGTGGMYGFPQITQLAGRTEERLSSPIELREAMAAVRELIELIRSVQGYDRSKENASHEVTAP